MHDTVSTTSTCRLDVVNPLPASDKERTSRRAHCKTNNEPSRAMAVLSVAIPTLVQLALNSVLSLLLSAHHHQFSLPIPSTKYYRLSIKIKDCIKVLRQRTLQQQRYRAPTRLKPSPHWRLCAPRFSSETGAL